MSRVQDGVQTYKTAALPLVRSRRPEWVGDVETKLGNLEIAAVKADSDLNAVDQDQALTDVGKSAQRVRIGRELLVVVDSFRTSPIGVLEARIDIITKALLRAVTPQPPTENTSALLFALAVDRVRGELASVPQPERDALYRSSHDNRYVSAAAEASDSPPVLARTAGGLARYEPKLISADVIRQCQLQRAVEQGSADEVRELRDLEFLRDVYVTAVNFVERDLLGRVPVLREERAQLQLGDRTVLRSTAEREMRTSPSLQLG